MRPTAPSSPWQHDPAARHGTAQQPCHLPLPHSSLGSLYRAPALHYIRSDPNQHQTAEQHPWALRPFLLTPGALLHSVRSQPPPCFRGRPQLWRPAAWAATLHASHTIPTIRLACLCHTPPSRIHPFAASSCFDATPTAADFPTRTNTLPQTNASPALAPRLFSPCILFSPRHSMCIFLSTHRALPPQPHACILPF